MINEELVIAIQQGASEMMPQLWNQVERLVAWKANKVISALGDRASVEYEDLYNSGYIALVDAVKRYDPERYDGFTGLFMLCLKTAFAEATGYRSQRQQRDPIHTAQSFDSAVPGTDDMVLGDIISDGRDYEEEIIDSLWKKERREAVEKALQSIPQDEETAIRLQFYNDCDVAESAEIMGLSHNDVTALRHKGLTHLRKPQIARELEQYVDTLSNFFLRTSVRSQQSPVELLVIRREELRNYAASRRCLDRERRLAK